MSRWREIRTVRRWAWPRIVWIEIMQWRHHWRVKLAFLKDDWKRKRNG